MVLITGDDDFTPRVQRAMNAGMDVEVLHPSANTSAALMCVATAHVHETYKGAARFLVS